MRVLTVPNWSFGRNRRLLSAFEEELDVRPLRIHYLESDTDHNRTVSAFSGEATDVFEALIALAHHAFDAIDLNRHVGVHPRIGALDVCPFVRLEGTNAELVEEVEPFAQRFSREFEVPLFLYEKSERGRHESTLPELRKAGFGGLMERSLEPDFGPKGAHPRLGVTVMGVRDFLIAFNLNLKTPGAEEASQIAREIRIRRREGDPRFLGVRALGFPLASRELSQVSLNLTLPDITRLDPIIEWATDRARDYDLMVSGTELIGVIRPEDLGERFQVDPRQIVEVVAPRT